MRLSAKLMAFVFAGIIFLLALDGYLTVHREIALFDKDMKRDALLLGRTMKGLVLHAWKTNGEEKALQLIKTADRDEDEIGIRWVWLDADRGSPFAADLPAEQQRVLAGGDEISFKGENIKGRSYRYTYVPLIVENGHEGALELSEPLDELESYTRESILRTLILAGVMAIVSWLMLTLLSYRFVAKPLKLLTDKTQEIGKGDLTADLDLSGHNELSVLASAMNGMCEGLVQVKSALLKETEMRIATLEQLRHAERLATLGRLAAGIAHELGTPLNVISGRARMLVTGAGGKKEMADNASIICDQVDKITKIMNQLLTFARRGNSNRLPGSLESALSQVFNILGPIARKQKVSFRIEGRKELPQLFFDSSQVQQVLINLFMNAIQAMPQGGTIKAIFQYRVTTTENGEAKEWITLAVCDEGKGIDDDIIKHLFDPFFTTKEVGQGTGLGLSISLGIMEDHGGRIDVDSTPGQGSCFTLWFPVEEV